MPALLVSRRTSENGNGGGALCQAESETFPAEYQLNFSGVTTRFCRYRSNDGFRVYISCGTIVASKGTNVEMLVLFCDADNDIVGIMERASDVCAREALAVVRLEIKILINRFPAYRVLRRFQRAV